jgi:hypothetical protein
MALSTTATLRATTGTNSAPRAARIVVDIVTPVRYAPRPEVSISPDADRRLGVIDLAECGSLQLG